VVCISMILLEIQFMITKITIESFTNTVHFTDDYTS